MAISRVDAAGALSVGAYGLLLALSRGGQDVAIGEFLGIMFGAWALLGLACTGSAPLSTVASPRIKTVFFIISKT